MYKSLETSKNLTWHKETTRVAGQLFHPSDSPSWRLVDHMWPDFESEPRNLCLALAADGINPHSNLSSRYSCWPVMLATYNLPPNMCMKRKFIMLTMLISGPKQPGNDIDVYLDVLVEDLQRLWEGVDGVYDAYRKHMRRKYLCKAFEKWEENVIFLVPRFHPYRRQTKEFNGVEEHGETPTPLSGVTLYDKLSNIKCEFGKKIIVKGKKRKKEKENNVEGSTEEKDLGATDLRKCWKKSIFFNLPYWKHLHVRHCLDVMHIEKNVFESLINTLMNVKGKTKDNVAARLDMLQMGVRPELRPKFGEKKTYLPPSACSFTKKEKLQVCQSLMDIKVPEGYSSNMKNLVFMSELKLSGLKFHDCHVLMQHFLPILICDALPKHVRYAIIRLCFFFKDICSKVIDVAKLDKLQSDLVVKLCLLEQYFPPSFFDVMVHLIVHLFQKSDYVDLFAFAGCSRKHPEGCIVQRYSAEEAIEFCSEYLNGVDPVGIPQSIRDPNSNVPGFLACNTPKTVRQSDMLQAHLTVLENTGEVFPYIIEHKTFLKSIFPKKEKDERWIQDAHNKRFIDWFRAKVAAEIDSRNGGTASTLTWLAHGPRSQCIKYSSYVVNSNLYQTKARDDERVCQNSGVSLVANIMLVSSAKDKNPLMADVSFYGVIEEIWELDYHQFQVPLFKCAWVANDKGVIKNDECGFTLVNLNKRGHMNDEFVLASQVNQVFYIDDPARKGWSIVLPVPNRCHEGEDDCSTNIPKSRPIDNVVTHEIPVHGTYFRTEHEGVWESNRKK
ncbi:uncharacterized protein [Henckelia pumila]|uniref:uncharacterized protein n=1 Tax=Henckelia pumila TaxID=405737 RepID=UPI003C6E8EF2